MTSQETYNELKKEYYTCDKCNKCNNCEKIIKQIKEVVDLALHNDEQIEI